MFSFLCFPFCLSTRPWRLCAQFVCLFIKQCTCLLLMEPFLIHPKRRVRHEVLQSGSRLQLCCAPVTRDTPPTCNHHLLRGVPTLRTRSAHTHRPSAHRLLEVPLHVLPSPAKLSSGVSGSQLSRSLRFTAASLIRLALSASLAARRAAAARSLSAVRLRSGARQV